jgi:hypothetical protein
MNNIFHSWFKDMKNSIVGKIVVGAPAGTPTRRRYEKLAW